MSLGSCELCQKHSGCECLTRVRTKSKTGSSTLVRRPVGKVKGSRDGIWRRPR